MNEKIYDLIEELNSAIAEDERSINLSMAEKTLSSSEKAQSLIGAKDKALDRYNEVLSYSDESSSMVGDAQKELAKAKLEMDNDESVRAYNKAYSKVRELYASISDLLFSDIVHLHTCEAHK